MDSITEEALVLLRYDGRMSYSEIARRLGTTRSAIASRITPRLESGELTIVAAVHPRMLGLEILAHVQVRVHGDVSAVARELVARTSAVFISETVGPFDIILELHSRNLAELHHSLGVIRTIDGVVELHFVIYEKVITSVFLDAEPEAPDLELDALDAHIINLLQADGRATYSDLADGAGLSINAVRARVRRMVDSGVVRIAALGQRSNSTGIVTFGLGLTLTHPDTAVVDVIAAQKRIDFLARTVGRYDLVATVPFDSVQAFTAFVAELRARDDVASVSTWLHARMWQERYKSAGTT